MTERTIPILPCRSIDDTLAFYEALGFAVTYRQERPNTFAAVTRGGIELQFFVLKALDPTANYSTCYVIVVDADALYEHSRPVSGRSLGRLPSRGIPVGALRDMSYGVRQFVVVDPGGNYIRIGQPIEPGRHFAPRTRAASSARWRPRSRWPTPEDDPGGREGPRLRDGPNPMLRADPRTSPDPAGRPGVPCRSTGGGSNVAGRRSTRRARRANSVPRSPTSCVEPWTSRKPCRADRRAPVNARRAPRFPRAGP